VSQEVSGPRRAVWDQADMQVRVSAYDGDCNVGDDEGKSVTRVSDVWILGSYACWILEHRKHQRPMRGVGRLGVWSDVTGWSLGQRNGGVPTWVDLAGIDPRDQTQGI